MPAIYTTQFRVRHYECDMYGHVNHANYARYMQEAAFEASAVVGYNLDHYAKTGYHWIVRETEIEYLTPLQYGDTVEVKTWVEHFRRVQSRRCYELTNQRTKTLCAQGHSDWVYLNSQTGRPSPIPETMKAAFFPEGIPAAGPKSDPFPEPLLPPDVVFTIQRQVAWRDVDPQQHLNNAAYISLTEDAGVSNLAAFGWPIEYCLEVGFAMVARRHHITYLTPAKLYDDIEVTTWLSDLRRSTAWRHYRLTRKADGEPLALARTHWVWVNLETGRPIKIPADFQQAFAKIIA